MLAQARESRVLVIHMRNKRRGRNFGKRFKWKTKKRAKEKVIFFLFFHINMEKLRAEINVACDEI